MDFLMVKLMTRCCVVEIRHLCLNVCVHDSSGSNKSFQLEQKLTLDKKFLLNGFLEDVFVAKASNVSKNVEWIEFVCSEFSSSCAYLQDSLVPSMHL